MASNQGLDVSMEDPLVTISPGMNVHYSPTSGQGTGEQNSDAPDKVDLINIQDPSGGKFRMTRGLSFLVVAILSGIAILVTVILIVTLTSGSEGPPPISSTIEASTISTTEYSTRVQTLTPEVSSTRVRKTTTEDTPTTEGTTEVTTSSETTPAMTETTVTTDPPQINASLLVECSSNGLISSWSVNFWWCGENTLIASPTKDDMSIKFDVNLDMKTCTASKILVEIIDMVCTKENDVYFIDHKDRKIKIYDIDTGNMEEWDTGKDISPHTIKMNKDYIIIHGMTSYGEFDVYNRKREFLYSRAIEGHFIGNVYDLTEDGFVLLEEYNAPLIMHDLANNGNRFLKDGRDLQTAEVSTYGTIVATADKPFIIVLSQSGSLIQEKTLSHTKTPYRLKLMSDGVNNALMAVNSERKQYSIQIYKI